MEEGLLQAVLVQGGLGTVAGAFIWLYIQERKDRKDAEKQLNLHLAQDIADKISDREVLQQALSFVKEHRDG